MAQFTEQDKAKRVAMYGYDIQCYLYLRPNKFDESFEYLIQFGKSVLQDLYLKETVDLTVKSVELWFPEAWLNVVQQRCLFNRLKKYCPNVETLVICTHSEHFITMLRKECILLIQGDETLAQECVTGLTYDSSITLPSVFFNKNPAVKLGY